MTPSLDGEIRDGRHRMQIRVYYEDTDFSGIVYHASYLRFMERGRTNHLRLMGAEQHTLFEQAHDETPGFAFVVRSMQIEFLKPARMDDLLDVVTRPEEVKGASILLAQEVLRDTDVLIEAKVRVIGRPLEPTFSSFSQISAALTSGLFAILETKSFHFG